MNNDLNNVKEALQTISKLEILLKMCNIDKSNIDDIQDELWKQYKENELT